MQLAQRFDDAIKQEIFQPSSNLINENIFNYILLGIRYLCECASQRLWPKANQQTLGM